MKEADWLTPVTIDQSQKFSGSTVLRGGQEPKVETRNTNIIE
jgi:hypothetical protein